MDILNYALAVLLLLVTPGPGVLSVAAVGSAFGWRPGLAYGTGLFLGSNAVMVAAAAGLAVVFDLYPSLRIAFTIVSSGYLLYIAWTVATAGSDIRFQAAERAPGVAGGLALQAFNPKAYAVGTFIFSNFPNLAGSAWAEFILKMVVLNLIWVPIHIGWLGLGIGLRQLDLAPRVARRINVAMAVAMVVVVLFATWTSF